MNKKLLVVLSLVVSTALAASASAAGPESKYRPPRTKEGRPDLQGVWNFASGVPLQRPAKLAGKKILTKEEFDAQRVALRNVLGLITKFAPVENVGFDWIDNKLYVEDFRTSLITYPENGRLPALIDGVRRMPSIEDILAALSDAGSSGPSPALASLLASLAGGTKDSHTDFNRSERCLDVMSVPVLPGFGDNYLEIIQSSDHVAIVMDYGRRVIALDSNAPASSKARTSMGTSKGRWEGDTLVVETRNFSESTIGFAGAGNSRDRVVAERFTPTPAGLEYAATIVDPSTFKDRIELSFPMARVDAHIYEATCHEGNYSLANTLSAARKEDHVR
ncbi:MAG TPA: hypothetical protein VLV86_04970 [Vicinamibacterales bacterium]|nr:hypothetical protein [Vicinamibacterales bacterium]